MGRALAWAVCLSLLLACTVTGAEDALMARVRLGVPLSCAAWALIRSADYPEAVRVFDEGHTPRDFAEADRASLGLLWRHRQQLAEDLAARAFTELYGGPPTEQELGNERSRWVQTLMSYPEPLREAVASNCETVFQLADQSCPTPRSGGR